MTSIFNWALFAHIIGIVFWVGGLLAASQVLADRKRQSSPEARAVLAHGARRFLKAMAHPGAAITVLAGVVLLGANPADLQRGWLHAKLAFVVILISVDLLLTVGVSRILSQGTELPALRVKLAYGSITLLFLIVVFLAVVKP